MKIRVIDYVGNQGGGVRYTVEVLKALMNIRSDFQFELVSYGSSLERYGKLLLDEGIRLQAVSIKPTGYLQNQLVTLAGALSLSRPLPGIFGSWRQWHFEVPEHAFDDCDLVWFPWMHKHRIPPNTSRKVVGTFHDSIPFQVRDVLPEWALVDEAETNRLWLSSSARIVATSETTVFLMQELFGAPPNRFDVIPISGEHLPPALGSGERLEWEWSRHPFLFYPANTHPHKNHEVLFKGIAAWGAKYPLVLTGRNTDLTKDLLGGRRIGRLSRRSVLRKLAEREGLVLGKRLHPIGYISNQTYYSLLAKAWAVVVPTLAEGGGSFPVLEAMLAGVPVLCSDIPVLREQLRRTGGEVFWFDPRDPYDLAQALENLTNQYSTFKARAATQISHIQTRSWQEVAEEYHFVLSSTI